MWIIVPQYFEQDALVAQLDRALDYESRGQGFESSRARHFLLKKLARFVLKLFNKIFEFSEVLEDAFDHLYVPVSWRGGTESVWASSPRPGNWSHSDVIVPSLYKKTNKKRGIWRHSGRN